jgi:hypothetical protein
MPITVPHICPIRFEKEMRRGKIFIDCNLTK